MSQFPQLPTPMLHVRRAIPPSDQPHLDTLYGYVSSSSRSCASVTAVALCSEFKIPAFARIFRDRPSALLTPNIWRFRLGNSAWFLRKLLQRVHCRIRVLCTPAPRRLGRSSIAYASQPNCVLGRLDYEIESEARNEISSIRRGLIEYVERSLQRTYSS